ncbi:hypothetical protein [Nostoc sp. UCD120]|uniref:hypothetical protein n=1 Tax=Nostoc sp. UCD120 TaxID=2681312 RepID=UPI0037C97D09
MNTDMRSLGTLQVVGRETMSDDKPLIRLPWGIIGRNVRCDRYYLGLISAKSIRSSDRCASLVAISVLASISGSTLQFLFRYLRLVNSIYNYRS